MQILRVSIMKEERRNVRFYSRISSNTVTVEARNF